jgi:hypothetical protein
MIARMFREESFHTAVKSKRMWERLSPWQVILQWTGGSFPTREGRYAKKRGNVKIVYAKLPSDIRLHFIVQRNRNLATERSVFMILLATQTQPIPQQLLHLRARYKPL